MALGRARRDWRRPDAGRPRRDADVQRARSRARRPRHGLDRSGRAGIDRGDVDTGGYRGPLAPDGARPADVGLRSGRVRLGRRTRSARRRTRIAASRSRGRHARLAAVSTRAGGAHRRRCRRAAGHANRDRRRRFPAHYRRRWGRRRDCASSGADAGRFARGSRFCARAGAAAADGQRARTVAAQRRDPRADRRRRRGRRHTNVGDACHSGWPDCRDGGPRRHGRRDRSALCRWRPDGGSRDSRF